METSWDISNDVSHFIVDCCLQPKVVSDADELELAKQLERLEAENAEVAGDDSNSEEEEESGEED